ncbi:MAG: fatty acid desaturase family protein [Sporichthyaceae bacterium]
MSATPAGQGSDFAPLLQAVRAHGLLRLRRRRYALLIGTDALALAAVWAVVWLVGSTWWQLLLAVPVAIFSVRMVFVGHDVGHRQVARTARVNRWLGWVVGDVVVGLGSHWWIDRHSRHHANPNEVGRDPDVGDGVLCWTPEQRRGRRGLRAWINNNQGRLFFPLLLLESLHLHLSSLRAARGPRDVLPLVAHFAAYVGLLLVVMGPAKAAVFALVHQALVGLHLGAAFAPNHKGMPMPPPGSRWDFLRKQVLTTRNVRGGPVLDWFTGNLNYQVEHHLFPSMPRPHLRRARPLVRAHCATLDIPYTETSLRTSLLVTVRHLQAVGSPDPVAPTRDRPAVG